MEYQSVSLSPDGAKIVYDYQDSNSPFLFYIGAMNVDGSNPEILYTTPSTSLNSFPFYPSYATDGSKIVFQEGGQIWSMNPDGTAPTQVTNAPGAGYCSIVSNGTTIAAQGGGIGLGGLVTMNADGSNVRLPFAIAYNVFPTFDTSGQKIIFSGGSGPDLYSINYDGTSLTQLSSNSYIWYPLVVDNTVYYTSIISTNKSQYEIFSIPTTGGGSTQVTNDDVYDGGRSFNQSCGRG
jgi:Tol biopolymer transport system component